MSGWAANPASSIGHMDTQAIFALVGKHLGA